MPGRPRREGYGVDQSVEEQVLGASEADWPPAIRVDRSDTDAWPGGVDALPAMPEPKRHQLRLEAIAGWTLVLSLTVIFVGVTHGVTLLAAVEMPGEAQWAFLVLIWVEALMAIGCLTAIHLGDPGIIRRSPFTCFPLPEEIAYALNSGESLDGLQNFVDERGRVFCVRCFVWRASRAHHCSLCQRCVLDHDHHCGVLGRCITGHRLMQCLMRDSPNKPPPVRTYGNMCYFSCLLAMAYLGGLTCLASSVTAVVYWRLASMA